MSQSASGKETEELDLDSQDLKMPPKDAKIEEEVSKDSKDKDKAEVPLNEMAKLAALLKESESRYLYAIAETDNIKKRHLKERSELIKYQGESIARDLLEILDDLERVAGVGAEASPEAMLEGITLIASRMKSIFDRYSIKGTDSIGTKFDPAIHEALTMVHSDEVPSGIIVQELKRSFTYKDKLLRPAQVVVSNGPKTSEDSE